MQSFNPIEDLFKGRHFDGQIIILCVAWYTSFKLSLRDLVIMMAWQAVSFSTEKRCLLIVAHLLRRVIGLTAAAIHFFTRMSFGLNVGRSESNVRLRSSSTWTKCFSRTSMMASGSSSN